MINTTNKYDYLQRFLRPYGEGDEELLVGQSDPNAPQEPIVPFRPDYQPSMDELIQSGQGAGGVGGPGVPPMAPAGAPPPDDPVGGESGRGQSAGQRSLMGMLPEGTIDPAVYESLGIDPRLARYYASADARIRRGLGAKSQRELGKIGLGTANAQLGLSTLAGAAGGLAQIGTVFGHTPSTQPLEKAVGRDIDILGGQTKRLLGQADDRLDNLYKYKKTLADYEDAKSRDRARYADAQIKGAAAAGRLGEMGMKRESDAIKEEMRLKDKGEERTFRATEAEKNRASRAAIEKERGATRLGIADKTLAAKGGLAARQQGDWKSSTEALKAKQDAEKAKQDAALLGQQAKQEIMNKGLQDKFAAAEKHAAAMAKIAEDKAAADAARRKESAAAGAGGGRGSSGGELKKITPDFNDRLVEGRMTFKTMDDIESLIKQNADAMGPIRGRVGEYNPYDETAQKFDADLRAAAQTIGKFLEGGKLAQGDDLKYRKMLPNLSDTPEVAQHKAEQLRGKLRDRYNANLNVLREQGYDVSGHQMEEARPPAGGGGGPMITGPGAAERTAGKPLKPGYVWVRDRNGKRGQMPEQSTKTQKFRDLGYQLD